VSSSVSVAKFGHTKKKYTLMFNYKKVEIYCFSVSFNSCHVNNADKFFLTIFFESSALQDVKKHQIYFVMVHDLRNISCCNYKYNLSEIHCLCDYSVVYEAQKVMITFSSNFLNFPCNSNMI